MEIEDLIQKIEDLAFESGAADGFDARIWFMGWIQTYVPKHAGHKTSALTGSSLSPANGWVHRLLQRNRYWDDGSGSNGGSARCDQAASKDQQAR